MSADCHIRNHRSDAEKATTTQQAQRQPARQCLRVVKRRARLPTAAQKLHGSSPGQQHRHGLPGYDDAEKDRVNPQRMDRAPHTVVARNVESILQHMVTNA